MKYTIDKHDRYIVIEPLTDVLNAEKAAKLKAELLLRNTTGQRNIVLDLSNVREVDEEGVRIGILANRLCHTIGGLVSFGKCRLSSTGSTGDVSFASDTDYSRFREDCRGYDLCA